jgi:hypothetical protein
MGDQRGRVEVASLRGPALCIGFMPHTGVIRVLIVGVMIH